MLKNVFVVRNRDGRLWAGYNSFTKRPCQARLYSSRAQAEATAMRCQFYGGEVVEARLEILGPPVPLKNADKFRALPDEELAKIFARFVPVVDCPPEVWDMITDEKLRYEAAWLRWLQMTAEEQKCPIPST